MLLVVGFLTSLSTGSTPSEAVTITGTFAGTFGVLSDEIGVFGSPGATYSNQPFSLVSTFSTEHGFYHAFPGGDAIQGGGSGVMTVNGVDHRFDGTDFGSTAMIIAPRPPALRSLDLNVVALRATNNFGVSINGFGAPSPIARSVLISFGPVACDAQLSCSGNIDIESGGLVTQGRFTISQFSTAVTPLPAGLPLSITAIAAIGLVGWRSRRRRAMQSLARPAEDW
jgi:hypothetical protein